MRWREGKGRAGRSERGETLESLSVHEMEAVDRREEAEGKERLTPTSDSIASNKVQSNVVPTFNPTGFSITSTFTGVVINSGTAAAGLSATTFLPPRRTSFATNWFDFDDVLPPPPIAGEEWMADLTLTLSRLVASPKGAGEGISMFSEREGVLMKKGKGERARGVEGGRGTMIAEGRVSARGERKVRGKFSANKGRVSVMNGDSHTLKRTEL